MRRRIPWIASVAVLVVALLSGCGGSKNADSVVKDLNKVAGKLESYQGSGEMILHNGQQPLTYKVEVWYQKPSYYRIALTNAQRDITQIVLRNDQGVFVLTPRLNKSYRFQSDWPENQGQVYLYQTLLQSIVLDNSRQFTTDKDSYVFDVMAGNYQNGSFARQKIWLAKTDYAPRHVEVTDTNNALMVEVNFNSFEFGKKFDKSAFDMQQNMVGAPNAGSSPDGSSSSGSQGDKADGTKGGDGSGKTTDGKDAPTGAEAGEGTADGGQTEETFALIEPDPDALPEGVVLKDIDDSIQLADSTGYMLRYTGTYDFTILESMPKDQAVSLNKGLMLDLGFTLGELVDDETTKSLTWTYEGVVYRLTTSDLPQEDMVKVAQSMVESSGK